MSSYLWPIIDDDMPTYLLSAISSRNINDTTAPISNQTINVVIPITYHQSPIKLSMTPCPTRFDYCCITNHQSNYLEGITPINYSSITNQQPNYQHDVIPADRFSCRAAGVCRSLMASRRAIALGESGFSSSLVFA